MNLNDKIKKFQLNQKKLVEEFEEVVKDISLDNSINDNILMKREIENLNEKLSVSEEKVKKLTKDNISAKMSLKEQIIDERSAILNVSKRKLEIYFKNEENEEMNRLNSLEYSARAKVRKINNDAIQELEGDYKEVQQEIEDLEIYIHEKIKTRRESIKASYGETAADIEAKYNNLQRDVSEDILAKKQKHNDLEVKIGLDWINKIGVILLLLGAATAMRYTYLEWFNDYMKCVFVFLLGGIMLGAGEWLNKKQKNLFALGLCGGGVGVLYLAVFSGYFFFEILNLPVSIILSVLITLGAIILSRRYNSMTIAGISLLGGYLPFFSFAFMVGIKGIVVYIAMGYLLFLNMLVLILAFERRWILMNYISFALNMPCLIYLIFISENYFVGMAYGLLSFFMYLGISLAYPIRKSIKLKITDLILIGVNTFSNAIIVYNLFIVADLEQYMGFLALVYALGYFSLSRFIYNKFAQEKHIQTLFSITALTFSILMIPFQFGIEWAAMGWLIEAILILIIAMKRDVEKIEFGGWILLGLCSLGFIIEDLIYGYEMANFAIRYSLLILGLIYILFIYRNKYNAYSVTISRFKVQLFRLFKYVVIVSSWIYSVRLSWRFYDLYVIPKIPISYIDFYKNIFISTITIVFAYGLLNINILKDKTVKGFAFGLLVLSSFMCLFLNSNNIGTTDNVTAQWIGVVFLIAYNVFVFINIKKMVLLIIKKKGFSIEFFPLILIIYFLGVTSQILTNQLGLQNANLAISVFFIVSALGCILFGFNKNYLLTRRLGLGLSIFSTAKLFLYDSISLTGLGKIIGYFCFGLTLLGISFIYQKLKTGPKEVTNEKKNLK